jgi:hypothetical protein
MTPHLGWHVFTLLGSGDPEQIQLTPHPLLPTGFAARANRPRLLRDPRQRWRQASTTVAWTGTSGRDPAVLVTTADDQPPELLADDLLLRHTCTAMAAVIDHDECVALLRQPVEDRRGWELSIVMRLHGDNDTVPTWLWPAAIWCWTLSTLSRDVPYGNPSTDIPLPPSTLQVADPSGSTLVTITGLRLLWRPPSSPLPDSTP